MKKNNMSYIRDQVYASWSVRKPENRKQCDTQPFIDELWISGLRMANSQALHYQHVMDTIRSKIED